MTQENTLQSIWYKDFEIRTFIVEVLILMAIIGLILQISALYTGSFPTTVSLFGIKISHLHSLWCGIIITTMFYSVGMIDNIIESLASDGYDWKIHGEKTSTICFGIMSVSFFLSVIAMFPYGVLGSLVFVIGIFVTFITYMVRS